ncbi:MAG: 3'-5' exonuclease [Saprospiraceae bacterium]|nr:3'-5' exonuclease [Saprospiraceae bacterium]MBP7699771.1 3'-5' exonuclease [Saprospiraceae bacterium]
MQLNLTRNLCFLDIESTGLNVIRDRIIQIAIVKYLANGQPPEELCLLVNPGIPISEEAMHIHGITPKDLANKPTFQQVAQKIFDFIGNSDIAGYNSNRFDIPLLMEEFARVGYEFNVDNRRTIDVQRIFYRMEPRTLKAALKFYSDEDLTDAHDALADVRATIAVFKGQLKMYEGKDLTDEEGNIISQPIVNEMQALHDFTNDSSTVDATQRFRRDHNGVILFNFGKFIGQPAAPILAKDKQYYNWMLNKEFSSQVKQIIKKIVKDYEQQQTTS